MEVDTFTMPVTDEIVTAADQEGIKDGFGGEE